MFKKLPLLAIPALIQQNFVSVQGACDDCSLQQICWDLFKNLHHDSISHECLQHHDQDTNINFLKFIYSYNEELEWNTECIEERLFFNDVQLEEDEYFKLNQQTIFQVDSQQIIERGCKVDTVQSNDEVKVWNCEARIEIWNSWTDAKNLQNSYSFDIEIRMDLIRQNSIKANVVSLIKKAECCGDLQIVVDTSIRYCGDDDCTPQLLIPVGNEPIIKRDSTHRMTHMIKDTNAFSNWYLRLLSIWVLYAGQTGEGISEHPTNVVFKEGQVDFDVYFSTVLGDSMQISAISQVSEVIPTRLLMMRDLNSNNLDDYDNKTLLGETTLQVEYENEKVQDPTPLSPQKEKEDSDNSDTKLFVFLGVGVVLVIVVLVFVYKMKSRQNKGEDVSSEKKQAQNEKENAVEKSQIASSDKEAEDVIDKQQIKLEVV